MNDTPVKVWAKYVDPHAWKEIIADAIPEVEFEPMINIAHNYAAWEHHYGEDVIVHRKGAVRARAGEIGIIPGSQGTSSYIVEGLGCPESFMSSSHGAGRLMSRTEAIKNIDEVMANQTGLVKIMTRLSPIAVIKG